MNSSSLTASGPDDSGRLNHLEGIIRAGKQTFLEVGEALLQIMQDRLYRVKGFGSFAEYTETVWRFKKSQAYNFMQAAAVINELPPGVSTIVEKMNPSQVRELVKVPKEQREAVVKDAVSKAKSGGRKLTAKDITRAAKPESVAVVAEQSAQAVVVTVEPVPIKENITEPQSIESKLRELWGKATIVERGNFLSWVRNQEGASCSWRI
jgi:hypothetical protein